LFCRIHRGFVLLTRDIPLVLIVLLSFCVGGSWLESETASRHELQKPCSWDLLMPGCARGYGCPDSATHANQLTSLQHLTRPAMMWRLSPHSGCLYTPLAGEEWMRSLVRDELVWNQVNWTQILESKITSPQLLVPKKT